MPKIIYLKLYSNHLVSVDLLSFIHTELRKTNLINSLLTRGIIMTCQILSALLYIIRLEFSQRFQMNAQFLFLFELKVIMMSILFQYCDLKSWKMKILWCPKLIWLRLKVWSNNFLLCWVTLIVISRKFPFHTIIMTSWLVVLHGK